MVAFVVTETDLEHNGYRSGIWVADTDDPSSVRRFTHASDENRAVRDRSPRWSPCGDRLAFVSNRGGRNRIWCMSRGGGEAQPLGEFTGNIGGLTWSPSGDRLAFTSAPPREDKDEENKADVYVTSRLRYKFNGRGLVPDDRRSHVWVMDAETGEVLQLTDSPSDDSSPSWSPDGESLLFTSDRRSELEMYYIHDLYRVPAAGGETERITTGQGPVGSPRLAPDGEVVAFFGHGSGDCRTANTELMLMAADGSGWRSLTADFDRSVGNSVGADARFDAGGAAPEWCCDGDKLLFSLTDGGSSRIYFADTAGECTPVEGLPPVISSYSVSAGTEPVIAAVGVDYDTPGDVWIIRPGEEPVQFTDFNREFFDGIRLSAPERVTFSGAEDWEIEGWLMKPIGYTEGEKYPLVLEIHGGPASTSGLAFFHQYQLHAAAGYGVMYTNPRGSKGYGHQHAHGVIGDWGGGDYEDLMAAVDFACEQDWVDPNRLGVTGGSYGGYMTNWMVGQTDRFAAAVTFRSISNMYTKYGCSDIGFYSNRRGMGDADLWDEEEFIMSRSPMRYAPRVKTPILIVHSEEDLRCPMEQAEQFYVALKRLGVECEFVRYAGENHDLSRSGKPYNRVDRLNRLSDWFARYLDGGTCGC